MPERMGDGSDKKACCDWCTLPFLSREDNRKTLENMTYHDVCFDQLETWWRANNAKQQKQKKPYGE